MKFGGDDVLGRLLSEQITSAAKLLAVPGDPFIPVGITIKEMQLVDPVLAARQIQQGMALEIVKQRAGGRLLGPHDEEVRQPATANLVRPI